MSVRRMAGVRLVKPIVYGNTAKVLDSADEEGNTHEWTLFLRPYCDEDLSIFIRKVEFKYDDGSAPCRKVFEEPPYEIVEKGSTEFKVRISMFFIDINEKPVTVSHKLNLTEPLITLEDGTACVVGEYYDEIVFQDPTLKLYKALSESMDKAKEHDGTKFYTRFHRVHKRQVKQLTAANEEIKKEIGDLRGALKDAHALLKKYRAVMKKGSVNDDAEVASNDAPTSNVTESLSTVTLSEQ